MNRGWRGINQTKNMKNAKEVQEKIFSESGLKTSVKAGVGSMKGYVVIWPILQNGIYPNIPFDFFNRVSCSFI